MSTTKQWCESTVLKSKSNLQRSTLFSLLFVASFVIAPSMVFSQTSSSGHIESIVYKFTVVDVVNPVQANEVQDLMMSKEFTTSCSFVDEADCFKLSSNERISYETLKEALLTEGFILSAEVFLSDGTVIRSMNVLNEEH